MSQSRVAVKALASARRLDLSQLAVLPRAARLMGCPPGRGGMYAFPLAGEILKEPLGIEGGYLAAGRVPGLGVTVDESVVER